MQRATFSTEMKNCTFLSEKNDNLYIARDAEMLNLHLPECSEKGLKVKRCMGIKIYVLPLI